MTLISNSLEGKMGDITIEDVPKYERTPFGKEMLKHFLFDPNYKNLNHGIMSSQSSLLSQSYSISRFFRDLPTRNP